MNKFNKITISLLSVLLTCCNSSTVFADSKDTEITYKNNYVERVIPLTKMLKKFDINVYADEIDEIQENEEIEKQVEIQIEEEAEIQTEKEAEQIIENNDIQKPLMSAPLLGATYARSLKYYDTELPIYYSGTEYTDYGQTVAFADSLINLYEANNLDSYAILASYSNSYPNAISANGSYDYRIITNAHALTDNSYIQVNGKSYTLSNHCYYSLYYRENQNRIYVNSSSNSTTSISFDLESNTANNYYILLAAKNNGVFDYISPLLLQNQDIIEDPGTPGGSSDVDLTPVMNKLEIVYSIGLFVLFILIINMLGGK